MSNDQNKNSEKETPQSADPKHERNQKWLNTVKHLNKAGQDALEEATREQIGTPEQWERAADLLGQLGTLIEEINATLEAE